MRNSRALTPNTILNGKYRIEEIVAVGGSGITYRATDTLMPETVAIKEYFPSTLATRDTTGGATSEITIITGADAAGYERGLQKFENEAANLARFQHVPGIVSVKSFFRENNTGYMVMEYIDGVTLKSYLESSGGKLPCEQTLAMMRPIMYALSTVHQAGIIHRDISPDNIMVTRDGQLKLIDFGAARFVGNEDAKSLTVLLKEGYAPPEQYRTDGKQGPWTDVYALCATMYRMISGIVPVDSVSRVVSVDKLLPLYKVAPVPKQVNGAIMKGMSTSVTGRYATVDELSKGFRKSNTKWIVLIAIAATLGMILLGVSAAVIMSISKEKQTMAEDEELSQGESAGDKDNEEVVPVQEEQEQDIEEIEGPTEEELLDHVRKYTDKEIFEISQYYINEYYFDVYSNYIDGENMIVDDFNGDGMNEICVMLRDRTDEELYYGDIYLFYSDGMGTDLYLSNKDDSAHFSNDAEPLNAWPDYCAYSGIKAVRFGNKKQVELVGLEAGLDDAIIYSYVFSLEDRSFYSNTEHNMIGVGMDGNAVSIDKATYIEKDEKVRFMEKEVYYLDGEYHEFALHSISYEDLTFDNLNEEMEKAQIEMAEYTYNPYGDFDCTQEPPILYGICESENDKIYMNYNIPLYIADTGKLFVTQKAVTVFGKTNDNKISFIGVMPGEVCEEGFFPNGKNAMESDVIEQRVFNSLGMDYGTDPVHYSVSRYGNICEFRFFSDMEDHIATYLRVYVDAESGAAVDDFGNPVNLQ